MLLIWLLLLTGKNFCVRNRKALLFRHVLSLVNGASLPFDKLIFTCVVAAKFFDPIHPLDSNFLFHAPAVRAPVVTPTFVRYFFGISRQTYLTCVSISFFFRFLSTAHPLLYFLTLGKRSYW